MIHVHEQCWTMWVKFDLWVKYTLLFSYNNNTIICKQSNLCCLNSNSNKNIMKIFDCYIVLKSLLNKEVFRIIDTVSCSTFFFHQFWSKMLVENSLNQIFIKNDIFLIFHELLFVIPCCLSIVQSLKINIQKT